MSKKLTKFVKENRKTVAIAAVAIVAIIVVIIASKGRNTSTVENTVVTTTTTSAQGPRFNPKTISENGPAGSYTIEAAYPVFKGIANTEAEARLNQIVADKINGEVAAFKNGVAERKTNTSIPQELKSYLTIDYKVEYLSDKLVSIFFNEEFMLAGDAHPGHKNTTINYNLENNTEITLTDLFAEGSGYLTFLSNNSIKYLKSLNISNDEMIKAGASAEAKNFSNFYITDQAIVFVFDYYTVAPGAAGMQKVFFTFLI